MTFVIKEGGVLL